MGFRVDGAVLACLLASSTAAAQDGGVDARPDPAPPPYAHDVPAVAAPQPDAGPLPDPAPIDAGAFVAPDPGARPDDARAYVDDTPAVVLDAPDAGVAEPPPPVVDEAEEARFGFGGVPALSYDYDNGFGFGALATVYRYDGTQPYKWAATVQLFATTKLLTDDFVKLDWVDVVDLPLRLIAQVGYLQTSSQNYCGIGAGVTCDPRDAERAAGLAGLAAGDEDFDRFVRRYHQVRFMAPYANLQARWAFNAMPNQVSVFGGWRGMYYVPGTWLDDDGDGAADFGPYPGSLYAQRFPQGEPGLASVLQVGAMLDARDHEAAPTRGYWIEASLRGASPFWGSAWWYGAFNTTLRGYVPLTVDRELVLAGRLMIEVMVGDPPVMELARVGGSQDFYAFGGSEMGRGVRVQRAMGKVKAFDQTELRWTPVHFDLFDQRFDFGVGGFVDAGLVGEDVPNLGPYAGELLLGFGGLARLAWNKDFVLRLDVAVSPVEDWAIAPYILVNNLF